MKKKLILKISFGESFIIFWNNIFISPTDKPSLIHHHGKLEDCIDSISNERKFSTFSRPQGETNYWIRGRNSGGKFFGKEEEGES
jgi:hypothetical protein